MHLASAALRNGTASRGTFIRMQEVQTAQPRTSDVLANTLKHGLMDGTSGSCGRSTLTIQFVNDLSGVKQSEYCCLTKYGHNALRSQISSSNEVNRLNREFSDNLILL